MLFLLKVTKNDSSEETLCNVSRGREGGMVAYQTSFPGLFPSSWGGGGGGVGGAHFPTSERAGTRLALTTLL